MPISCTSLAWPRPDIQPPQAGDLVVFDLDGTLIDSAPQIIAAANSALGRSGSIGRADIGPPLRSMLAQAMAMDEQSQEVDLACARFAAAYDDAASQSAPYPGIAEALAHLQSRGCHLGIATNKRRAPTRSIIHGLGWSGFFDGPQSAGIWALEDFEPARLRAHWPHAGCKSSALAEMACRHPWRPGAQGGSRFWMVGDTVGDRLACSRARYDAFIFARWGAERELTSFAPTPAMDPLAWPDVAGAFLREPVCVDAPTPWHALAQDSLQGDEDKPAPT